MRRIFILAFSFIIFLLSFSIISVTKTFAVTESLIASPSSQPVNYELPYPGLLPDNPLYSLRAIRDKIISFLISDPLKKTEFNLLQADKRLNAGIYLFNKGKISLALSTISKAENYFEEALGKIEEAKMQKLNIGEIKGKLKDASRKHEQELKFLIQKVDKNSKAGFEELLRRVVGFEERLSQ
jgi:hypothetical protein